MAFVLLGLVLLVTGWLEIGPAAGWPLWVRLLPFGLALLWWWWSDVSGRTRRVEDQKYQDLKAERRRRATEFNGLQDRRRRRSR
ncbi:TIGR04438 family Trp-rich protein [Leptothrix sp. BB-4]